MPPQTAQLLLPRDLDDAEGGPEVSLSDRDALNAVLTWVRGFVAQPNEELGRPGTVCPFVPGALERNVLWLAPERVEDLDVAGVADIVDGYKRQLLAQTSDADGERVFPTIMVVFTDLTAERASTLFGEVLGRVAGPSYEEDGVIFGPFYDGNEGTAIYNPEFRPFQSPLPFMFVRFTVAGDWKFFIDDPAWLDRWARRFGPAAASELAGELRGLPWNARRDGA